MSDYPAWQIQQIDRAKTFADIRRIEDRASRTAQAAPEVRRGSAWLLRALAGPRISGSRGLQRLHRHHDQGASM